MIRSRGDTDLERGYGDVRPWRPPFHASPAARKDPISSKWVSSQDPLLRKFGNFGLYSLNFHPNFSSQDPNLEIFSSQAPKFRNFQLTSPQIWKFSAHKTPFSEVNVSSQAPHFGNPGRTPLPEKKLSAPPIRFKLVLEIWVKFDGITYISSSKFEVLWKKCQTGKNCYQNIL